MVVPGGGGAVGYEQGTPVMVHAGDQRVVASSSVQTRLLEVDTQDCVYHGP